ncbi:MAG: phosphoribosylformylglycinamidine synthase, partial [Clostridiales bacterium]|nr:phosphoribosylformylglycinamidine synthase [Clostridiales bacterium]
LIKRCNDFGAGGVSVAIGELADGIEGDLDKVPVKYPGLDGTELAISESQERMAVVVDAKQAKKFVEYAQEENLEATIVAKVTKKKRLVMKWKGNNIVDIDREFLNSNGAEKHIDIVVQDYKDYVKEPVVSFTDGYKSLVDNLNVCSQQGLAERFDSTAGAGAVLMPFGGKYQLTPVQAMVNKIAVENKFTDTCSVLAYGYNPFISEKSPYHGAYLAVIESVSKLIACGASFDEVYLTFQEYFERLEKDAKKWGKPLAALLGAYKAQKELGIAAVGGKDSMSGSFENLNVPPTLVSFAITTASSKDIISNEFKKSGNKVVLIKPEYDKNHLPKAQSLITIYHKINKLIKEGKVLSCYTPAFGGIAEAIFKMSSGNKIGFRYNDNIALGEIFDYNYGAFILELAQDLDIGIELGVTTKEQTITYKSSCLELNSLIKIYQDKLEKVFPCNIPYSKEKIEIAPYSAVDRVKPKFAIAKPKVLIPIFPGTTGEYEAIKAWQKAGAKTDVVIVNNLNAARLTESIKNFAKKLQDCQIVFLPSGLSAGAQPDGAAKFITAFFRDSEIAYQTNELLKQRDGLMGGIGDGFHALIKLGLVPYGEIEDIDENSPMLTFNAIGRHQSKIVRTKVVSNKSPWLSKAKTGEVYNMAISTSEGRFLANDAWLKKLEKNGQIATTYVDLDGNESYDIRHNPTSSDWAIEGITSPDGKVLGKMGHCERIDIDLYKNVTGNYDMKLFESATEYFK